MRQLEVASIQSYRLDLVCLHGSLLADAEPRLAALAPTVAAMLDEARVERELCERAEETENTASAARGRRDTKLDRTIITFGGATRAIAEEMYKRFFGRLSPSRVAKSALDDELLEVRAMIDHFNATPADDAIRVAPRPRSRGTPLGAAFDRSMARRSGRRGGCPRQQRRGASPMTTTTRSVPNDDNDEERPQ